MASGRIGGTRSKITGRVGREVYQIHKDASGSYEQVVYSLPDEKDYTNTKWQAINRMMMGLVERAMGMLQPIIIDSFEAGGGLSESANLFAAANYSLVRRDFEGFLQHPGSYAVRFDWPLKGVEQKPAGAFNLSSGRVVDSSAFVWMVGGSAQRFARVYSQYSTSIVTLGQWRAVNRWHDGYVGYWVFLLMPTEGHICKPVYIRLKIREGVSDSVVLSASNWADVFDVFCSWSHEVSYSPVNGRLSIQVNWADHADVAGVASYCNIISRYISGQWYRSSNVMALNRSVMDSGYQFRTPADVWSSWCPDEDMPSWREYFNHRYI